MSGSGDRQLIFLWAVSSWKERKCLNTWIVDKLQSLKGWSRDNTIFFIPTILNLYFSPVS